MKKINVYKKTLDDWYPSYKLTNNVELVKVSFTTTGPNPPINGEWRVCVWGNDDCGMEIDFIDEKKALSIFMEILGCDYVNMELLKDLGFKSA
jgi:hypothetical protein